MQVPSAAAKAISILLAVLTPVLSLFFGVMVFIFCGTEHCVADMFYFWMAGLWSGRAILSVLVISLGNAAGGVLFATLHRFVRSA